MLLNLHTHLPAPRPDAVISCRLSELPDPSAFPGQLYSVGIHPWDVSPLGLDETESKALQQAAEREDVIAIGECGIDLLHLDSAPMFSQLLVMKKHIEISEKVGKPLILHCVKAYDSIIGLRKEYAPRQRWIIHGFRAKPTVARMLLQAGIDLSYGERFNPESVALTPPDRLFAETDESTLTIAEIIRNLNSANPLISPESINTNLAHLFAAE